MKKWNMKKTSKEKWAATQETVYHVLSNKDGNEMQYNDLLEMVNNYFRFSMMGNAVALMLKKQKEAGYIEVSTRMIQGHRQLYWKLVDIDKDTFLNPPKEDGNTNG